MKRLKIASNLSLPIDVATEKLAWLGATGSGKTYGASKLAESMLDAGVQIVVLDYVGVWYGLRLAADGKTPGIVIPVFGGLRGDLKLEPTAGAMMADLIVDRTMSVILDVSQFEFDTDKARFGAAFADRLFFRKKSSPSPIHLYVEEAQEFIPQNPQKGEEKMLHAFNRMQKLGRNFGIGTSLVTQRPQEVNKKALNLAQTLFAFRTTGPHERKSIADWMADKGLDQDIAGDLPKLATGTAHCWSPEFLKMSELVTIDEKWTFDASATPKVGAVQVKAKELAPIDLKRIEADMRDTIERAKDSDPKELRKAKVELQKRVDELEKQIAAKPTSKAPKENPEKFKARVVAEAERIVNKKLKPVMTQMSRALNSLAELDGIKKMVEAAWKEIEVVRSVGILNDDFEDARPMTPAVRQSVDRQFAKGAAPIARDIQRTIRPERERGEESDDVKKFGKCERKIAETLASYPDGLEIGPLALLSGYRTTGGFRNSLSALRTAGYMVGENTSTMRLTEGGLDWVGGPRELPSGEELVQYWATHPSLGKCERAIVDVLLTHRKGLAIDVLAEKSGYGVTGGFRNSLSALRAAQIVVGRNTETMRLADNFFA